MKHTTMWIACLMLLAGVLPSCEDSEGDDDTTGSAADDDTGSAGDDDAGDDDAAAGPSSYPKINMDIWGSASAAWYAEFDWIILPGDAGAAVAAKALNPDLLVSSTRDFNVCEPDGEVCPEAWRVKDADGNWVDSYSEGRYLGNTSEYCEPYNGQTYRDHIIEYSQGLNWEELDGWNTDGLWANIDWLAAIDIDGDGDHDGTDNDLWMQGRLLLFEELRAALPAEEFITVNSGIMKDFDGQGAEHVNGVMAEKFMVYSGWQVVKDVYRYYAENAPEPHLCYIDNHFQGDPGADASSKENYRFMRFGLATTLLYDGYYSYKDGEEGATNEHWWNRYYDEYDVPLGEPLADNHEIRTDVFCRFFEGGAMILNGAIQDETVTEADLMDAAEFQGLDWDTIAGEDGHYYRFAGQQNPGDNDGSSFESITLASESTWVGYGGETRRGDGILLVRSPMQVVAAAVIVDTENFVTSPGADDAAISGFVRSCDYGDGFRTGRNYCDDVVNPYYGHTRSPCGAGGTATFGARLVHEGNYRVYEYHPLVDGNAVPHRVVHADGEETVVVDQNVDAEQWNLLGTYRFTPAADAQVVLTDSCSGTEAAADAMRFEWAGAD
jgi:hypothetical protein